MNFVGHAMAARWEREDPRFVLGAMLPDFVHMCGARLTSVHDPAIAAGVSSHHRADAVFHDTQSFRALCAQARAQLSALGVRRPTAMAAAHVGVELLLDGCWLEDSQIDSAYTDALTRSASVPATVFEWRNPEHAPRLDALLQRLRAAGAPHGYRDPEVVGQRITRVLSGRPRLAPGPHDPQRLVRWAQEAQVAVRNAEPALREQLREGLARAADAERRARAPTDARARPQR